MIIDRAAIEARLSRFELKGSSVDYTRRVRELAQAVASTVQSVSVEAMQDDRRVHIALSGGVDSTVLLACLVKNSCEVVAHTLTAHEDSPDVLHAKQAAAHYGVEHVVHVWHQQAADNYAALFRCIADRSSASIHGDCIDELAGGYYVHADCGDDTSRREVHREMLSRLPVEHLTPMDLHAADSSVNVYLPYASAHVVAALSQFSCKECFGDGERKRPIIDLARLLDVPSQIILRRKFGLVSALE